MNLELAHNERRTSLPVCRKLSGGCPLAAGHGLPILPPSLALPLPALPAVALSQLV